VGHTGGIVPHASPQVQIKPRQFDPTVLHDLTISPRGSNLVFRKVRKDLTDRPLVLAGPCRELLIGRFGNEFGENPWGLFLQR